MTAPQALSQDAQGPRWTFYRTALTLLDQSRVPYLIGGAHALGRYTEIVRDTKDLDIFVKPEDCPRILAFFAQEGYRTELLFSHWIGKIYLGDDLIDVIFSSGNGVVTVDQTWFDRAIDGTVLNHAVKLCAPEEIIWSKASIMERNRFDGADIAHILRARAEQIDWAHLLERFGPHWRILLVHLVLFGFVYPSERRRIPAHVMRSLMRRLDGELNAPPASETLCQGTILSLLEYLVDVNDWGYKDARLIAHGGMMTPQQIHAWTDAFLHPRDVA